jgi:hypothetical protein
MTDSRIGEWLQQAGLGKYRGNFLGMSEDTFLNLLMQEYGKYGVTDPSDKHALFKLTKLVRQQLGLSGDAADGCSGHHQQEQLHAPGDLLDLDAHDGDLLEVSSRVAGPLPVACSWDLYTHLVDVRDAGLR